MLPGKIVSVSGNVERTHAYLAKSVEAVSGPRILYSTFAPWMLPTFGKRYGVGVEYAIRILGLNNQICNLHEVLVVNSRRAASYQNPWSLLFVVIQDKSVRCMGVDVFQHVFGDERR